eukprot:Nk52_evm4s2241 gene=Nk52_evmTU4s2241
MAELNTGSDVDIEGAGDSPVPVPLPVPEPVAVPQAEGPGSRTGLSDVSSVNSSTSVDSSDSPISSTNEAGGRKKVHIESEEEDEEGNDESLTFASSSLPEKKNEENSSEDEDVFVADEEEEEEDDDESEEFVPSEEEEDDDFDDIEESEEEEFGTKKRGRKAKKKDSDRLWEADPDLYQVRRSGRAKAKPSSLYDDFIDDGSSDDSYGRKRKKKAKKTKGKAAKKGRGRKQKSDSDDEYDDFVEYTGPASRSKGRSSSEESDDEFTLDNKKKKKRKLKNIRKGRAENAPVDSGLGSVARFSVRMAAANVSYKDDSDDLSFSDELIETPVYTPLPEDENLENIEKVLQRKMQTSEDGKEEFVYYIKWMKKSYLHCSWHTEEELNTMEIKGLKKLSNFIKKEEAEDRYKAQADREEVEFMEFQEELNNDIVETYKEVERVIDLRDSMVEEGGQEVYCKWRSLPYSECTWETMGLISKDYQEVIDAYLDRQSNETIPNPKTRALRERPKFQELKTQPEYLGKGDESMQLRDYQLQGLNWLAHSWCKNNSSILADEMGLGKTIQTISFISYLFHTHKVYGPFIIVVPLSTITAWQRELQKWGPDMNALMYLGDSPSRQIIREKEFYVAGTAKVKFNVLLTTFEIVLMDCELLGRIKWASLLVDEAHRLKNSESQLHQVLVEFHTNHRLLITGTPLQNSLKELYALLVFIMPKYFPPWEEFEAIYQNLESQESVNMLHQNLEPFLLRRVKKDVEKSLPPKTERILRVGMSELQKQYYKFILTKNYKMLSKGTGKANLLNIMVELKKCCNHPDLIVEPEFHYTKDTLHKLISVSGKLKLLDKLLVRLKETGHRVLIFSQMVKMLDVLEEYLHLKGYYFQRLDGSIRGEKRKQAMDQFNAPDSRDFCFLLSTRAGGLGINLATADTVIIFDSDWNPQNDLQAEARAHRIGQKNVVNIYRLVTMHSVEETVIEKAKKKMVLDHVVIQRMDTTGKTLLQSKTKDQSSSVPFDKDELDAIMKFGAENLFKEKEENEGEKEDDDMDIDEILSRAEVKEGDSETSKNDELLSQFKVANFKTEEDDKTWDDIIPEKEKAKIEEEERQKQAMDMFLPPRKRKAAKKVNMGYDVDDDGEEKPRGRGRSSRAKAPISGRPADGSFRQSETRVLLRGLRKWGLSERTFGEIMSECGFDEVRSREEVIGYSKKILAEAEQAVKDFVPEPGSRKKTATIAVDGIPLSCNDFVNRIKDLDILEKRISQRGTEKFRAAVGAPVVKWDCKWGPANDGMLLVGVYFHGFGSWDAIRLDERLGLESKIVLEDDKSPQSSHLSKRVDVLLKHFRVEEQNMQAKAKVAKPSSSTKKSKSSSRKREREYREGTRKSKRSRNGSRGDEENEEDEGEDAVKERTRRLCKRYMRPVKSTLMKIDGLPEEAESSNWEPSYELQKLKQYLVIVGDHIDEVVRAYIRDDGERKQALRDLWEFTAQFSSKIDDPKKLRRLYKIQKEHEEQEKEKEKARSESSGSLKINLPKLQQ